MSEIVLVSFDADRKVFYLSFLLVCLNGGIGLIFRIHRCGFNRYHFREVRMEPRLIEHHHRGRQIRRLVKRSDDDRDAVSIVLDLTKWDVPLSELHLDQIQLLLID